MFWFYVFIIAGMVPFKEFMMAKKPEKPEVRGLYAEVKRRSRLRPQQGRRDDIDRPASLIPFETRFGDIAFSGGHRVKRCPDQDDYGPDDEDRFD